MEHTDPGEDAREDPIGYAQLLVRGSTSAGCFGPIAEPSLAALAAEHRKELVGLREAGLARRAAAARTEVVAGGNRPAVGDSHPAEGDIDRSLVEEDIGPEEDVAVVEDLQPEGHLDCKMNQRHRVLHGWHRLVHQSLCVLGPVLVEKQLLVKCHLPSAFFSGFLSLSSSSSNSFIFFLRKSMAAKPHDVTSYLITTTEM